MSAQIVEIGDFRLKRERRVSREGCQHKRLTLDDQAELVTCDDCHLQVGNYAALRMLVERWALLQERADRQQAEITAAAKRTIELRAAQVVERAWRSRSMVPACPHCMEAIFANDGFGATLLNKAIALSRAEARSSARTAPCAHSSGVPPGAAGTSLITPGPA